MTRRSFGALLLGLTLALGACFFVLPSVGPNVFLSPDETANAVTSHGLVIDMADQKGAGFWNFPWLHPRSFVMQGEKLLPVGFLGIPILMSAFVALVGNWALVLFTPLLAISVVVPLVSFVKKWGRIAQVGVVVGWLTFPTVILYANRGLFPNLPVICFTVWAAWLVWAFRSRRMMALAGVMLSAALIIRPIEAVWALPWVLAAFWSVRASEPKKRLLMDAMAVALPCLVLCALAALVSRFVYGSWFVAGYQLHDTAFRVAASEVANVVRDAESHASILRTWPFGVHPRNVWFNVQSYLIVYLLPWFVLTILAGVIAIRKKGSRLLPLVGLYTCAVLSAIYGEALYQDHVGVNLITLANSFLRYTLPLSVFAALSLAWLTHLIKSRIPKYGTVVAVLLIAIIGACGLWTAFLRDDEGIMANRKELVRYLQIRRDAAQVLSHDTIVASDRSDKIFFPVWQRVVSPMRPKAELYELALRTNLPLALYTRTLTPEQIAEWKAAGLMLNPILLTGNETLYLALPL